MEVFQICCQTCAHLETRYSTAEEFLQETRRCSCCNSVLSLVKADPKEITVPNSNATVISDDRHSQIPLISAVEQYQQTANSIGSPSRIAINALPLESTRVGSLSEKASDRAGDKVVVVPQAVLTQPDLGQEAYGFQNRESGKPKDIGSASRAQFAYYDFAAVDSACYTANQLQVSIEVPVIGRTERELAVAVDLKSSLTGGKFAIWLQRENEVGSGREDFRHWTGVRRIVKLPIDEQVSSYELCVQPAYARNWFWSIDIPVYRHDSASHENKTIVFDLSRKAEGNAVVLEGIQNIQISAHENKSSEIVNKKLELDLHIRPCKARVTQPKITFCNRRERSVSEFTFQFFSDRSGRETWNVHGGNCLAFGKDKPLPDRDNHNDIVFRPHAEEKIWSQVSRTHGILEVVGSKLRFQHSTLGSVKEKQTWVRFSNGKILKVVQPSTFDVPDPTEVVQFWPKLSVDISQSQLLQVRAWRSSDRDFSRYSWLSKANSDFSAEVDGNLLGGLRVDIVNCDLQVIRQHFLVSKSLTIGSSPSADICIRDAGVEAFHAYLLWIDGHLWLEPYNQRCSIEVNGKKLHVDQLFPLEKNIQLNFGENVKLEVLPFDANASLSRHS